MVIKEYNCPRHGYFEASHPICHHMGCESEGIERVFLTPTNIKSDKTKFTDNSLNQIAKNYGLSDMSNRDGKAVKSETAAIWGKEGVNNYAGMLEQASQHDGGMKLAAPTIQARKLPPAQVVRSASDSADRAKVMTK